MQSALSSLPHGPEFRFLDVLDALVPGKSGTGRYTVRGTEAFLPGHFPGNPLMPGVLLIEAVAQLGGVVAQSSPDIPPMTDVRLTAVQNAKILGSALPGEIIHLKAAVTARMDGLVMLDGSAEVHGRPILSVRLTLSGNPA